MRRLNALLVRLGAPGVLGLGLLLACIGFYVSGLAPLERELGAQRAGAEALRTRSSYQPASASSDARELHHFFGLFPTLDRMSEQLGRIYALARRQGLELTQGEYRLEKGAGLWSYRVILPLRGSYAQVRGFVTAVLSKDPVASVDALRLERGKPDDTALDAKLRLTLHFRAPGGSP